VVKEMVILKMLATTPIKRHPLIKCRYALRRPCRRLLVNVEEGMD